MFQSCLEILPPAQLRLWPEMAATPSGFTFYGGTAIALRLGHRSSVDFNFFGRHDFDPDALLDTVPYLRGARVLQREANTLTCLVDRQGPVQISFFGVPRIGIVAVPDLAEGPEFPVASLLDLAGTKVSVVQKRAQAKDYVDIDVLIARGGIGLPLALAAGRAIYGRQFEPQITLKALAWFDDGDVPSLPMALRRRLVRAVTSVDLGDLPALVPMVPPT